MKPTKPILYTLADLAAADARLARHFVEAPHAGPGPACWLWTGCMSRRNGKLSRPKTGRIIGGRRETLPYRVVYQLLTGQLLLPGMQICHYRCHNRRCGQPACLVAGSNGDNVAHERAYRRAA